ncbi:hypothetical protein CMI47_01725 [Candidatus Pacearchaeota archaeon]|nr:hypothetical protein [Candidatus Pacearchaeota archaeon]
MFGSLIKLANHLDNNGYHKEADYLDAVLKKYADPASKNTDANYILVTNAITAKIFELADQEAREGAFTYEIYKSSKGSYYQFNIVDKQFHMKAQQSALKQSTSIQREAGKIVREHLVLDESDKSVYYGTNDYHSWKLAQ